MVPSNELVEALRKGDEAAFITLIEEYHASLFRTALVYVDSVAVAEEVVQDVWIGVLKGIHKFENRSSLKTWLFSILIHQAKTRAYREKRYEPFSPDETSEFEAAVQPDRFYPQGHTREGHWTSFPEDWDETPEEILFSQEVMHHIQQAISDLPANQREVITLRDIEQLDTKDVCAILEITEGNQRVLLHRARSKVRQALEVYLSEI